MSDGEQMRDETAASEQPSAEVPSDSEYRIEPFSLTPERFSDVSELISTAFIEDNPNGGTIAFDATQINLLFGSPYLPRDLFVRAVHIPSGETVGFLGGLTRQLAYAGRTYRCGVPGFLAVHWKHQRRGLAVKMGLELLNVSKALDFDVAIAFFEPGAHGITMARSVARKAGLTMREIARIPRFLVRVIDPDRAVQAAKVKFYEEWVFRALKRIPKRRSESVRPFVSDDIEALFALMGDHVKHNQLALVRDRDDFGWFLEQPGIQCVVHERDGAIDGFIVAWTMDLAGPKARVPFGWIDLVHTYRLDSRATRDLCHELCRGGVAMGWAGLQSPKMPYFAELPFYRARFLPFPKPLIVTLFDFCGADFPQTVERYYLDFR
ncbi:MAG: hypothetical protein KC609_04975 [Myxococcales bacterium]|nr:hypothetical protein [Myxococcales bacterium]